MSANLPLLSELLSRIRGEYLEMPGLQLTIAQAQRLWGLDRSVCQKALEALEECHFLRRTMAGAFVRVEQTA